MKNRLVCECYNLYIDDIRNEIKKGNDTFEKIQASVRLGVLCSACIEDGKKVIDEILSKTEK